MENLANKVASLPGQEQLLEDSFCETILILKLILNLFFEL